MRGKDKRALIDVKMCTNDGVVLSSTRMSLCGCRTNTTLGVVPIIHNLLMGIYIICHGVLVTVDDCFFDEDQTCSSIFYSKADIAYFRGRGNSLWRIFNHLRQALKLIFLKNLNKREYKFKLMITEIFLAENFSDNKITNNKWCQK